jgi:hypothetical protein
MTQVVYLGYWDNSFGLDIEPLEDHINKNILIQKDDKRTLIQACPAFNNYIKNVFVVRSTFQYGIEWTKEHFESSYYDQQFFESYILPRSNSTGVVSFRPPLPVFISESNDLTISQESAYLHDNDITRLCYTIPGTFNIGKHFPRSLELALKFKQPGLIKIDEGDALYYVRFHTNEDIVFKKFIITDDFKKFIKANLGDIRQYTKGFKTLEWWYDLVSRHKFKKYFLKYIKQNLL